MYAKYSIQNFKHREYLTLLYAFAPAVIFAISQFTMKVYFHNHQYKNVHVCTFYNKTRSTFICKGSACNPGKNLNSKKGQLKSCAVS